MNTNKSGKVSNKEPYLFFAYSEKIREDVQNLRKVISSIAFFNWAVAATQKSDLGYYSQTNESKSNLFYLYKVQETIVNQWPLIPAYTKFADSDLYFFKCRHHSPPISSRETGGQLYSFVHGVAGHFQLWLKSIFTQ